MKHFSALLFLSLSFATLAQKETPCQFHLLKYGIPPSSDCNAKWALACKWNLAYWWIAGSVVLDEFKDSVKTYNDSILLLIEQKYGKDWETLYMKDVSEECEKQEKVFQLLNGLNYIQTRQAELRTEGKELHYRLNPQTNDCYYATAEGWGILNGEPKWVIYYTFYVRLKRNEVILLDDKIHR